MYKLQPEKKSASHKAYVAHKVGRKASVKAYYIAHKEIGITMLPTRRKRKPQFKLTILPTRRKRMQLTGLIVPIEKRRMWLIYIILYIGLPIYRAKASQHKAAAKSHCYVNPECKHAASVRSYRAEPEVRKAMFKKYLAYAS